jgi:ATP-dependent DNA ligase
MDPREKRLAVRVEDHPLDYADFEGVIPEGQCGAGEVILWDTGPYRNRTKRDGVELPLERALDDCRLVVELFGSRLYGQYALTRIGSDARGRERWLLVEKRDGQDRARDRRASAGSLAIQLDGRTAEIPRSAKPLFPSGITKADLARYHEGVAPTRRRRGRATRACAAPRASRATRFRT